MQRPLERHPVAGCFISPGHQYHSTFWSSDSTYATVLSSLSLYKPKEAVGNDSLFRATSSGTQRARIELRIDNPNKGETMETILIVLLVLFLIGGGGWGYSRWRR
jgi:hypothetical protein